MCPPTSRFKSAHVQNPDWVQHLIATRGQAAAGGLRYYILDNEPASGMQPTVIFIPPGPQWPMSGQDMISYGLAIKALDPGALVVGPEECDWDSYFYSGYDQWYCGHQSRLGRPYPDRADHGDMDYLPWLLNQLWLYDQDHPPADPRRLQRALLSRGAGIHER